MPRSKKAFHFDLDVSLLKTYYPSSSPNGWNKAWSDIRAFMESNGFERTQYSGYESTKSMTYILAYNIIEDLNEKYPWFHKCVRAASLTNIGREHDVVEHLDRLKGKEKYKEGEEPPLSLNPKRVDAVSILEETRAMKSAAKALESDASYDTPSKDEQAR